MRLFVFLAIAATIAFEAMPGYTQTEDTPPAFSPRSAFLVSGYGFVNAVNPDQGASSFSVGFNPIFLWKASDKLFFEGELEFGLEDGATEVGLEYAQIFWLTSNYLILGAGKFLNPANYFMERLHPTWINKLPTMPLGVSGHSTVPLIATAQMGVQARGGIPVGRSKLTYAVYVANGPTLSVEDEDSLADGGHGEGAPPGTLNFSNTNDNNGNKAIGGRIAIVPMPWLQLGYGIESSKVGDPGTEFENVRSLSHSADLNYVRTVGAIKGRVDIRSQFVWLSIDNPNQGLLTFENKSSSWYGQLAYQPTKAGNAFVSNTEVVFRYDEIDLPEGAPVNEDQYRVAAGLNYWFTASGVFKFSFERTTTQHEDGDVTENMVIGQMTMGF